MKKIITFAATAMCVLGLTAGTASAHFCYNAKRSDKGTEQVAARSNGFATYAEMLVDFGVCADGIEYVEVNGPDSIPLDQPVNSHATMAGGRFTAATMREVSTTSKPRMQSGSRSMPRSTKRSCSVRVTRPEKGRRSVAHPYGRATDRPRTCAKGTPRRHSDCKAAICGHA